MIEQIDQALFAFTRGGSPYVALEYRVTGDDPYIINMNFVELYSGQSVGWRAMTEANRITPVNDAGRAMLAAAKAEALEMGKAQQVANVLARMDDSESKPRLRWKP